MYKYGTIKIEKANNHTYRTNGQYVSQVYSCDIVLKKELKDILLATYQCNYTIKKDGGNIVIEYPNHDINTSLFCAAPEEWSVCMVTEVLPTGNRLLQATFNIYRQIHHLGNKRYYATKTVDII